MYAPVTQPFRKYDNVVFLNDKKKQSLFINLKETYRGRHTKIQKKVIIKKKFSVNKIQEGYIRSF